MNATRTTLRLLQRHPRPLPPSTTALRTFTHTALRTAEGDTGSLRPGGQRTADSWNRREKAAEDMYIRGREKAIIQLLREKIVKQEEALAKDRAMLVEMEDVCGRLEEGRERV